MKKIITAVAAVAVLFVATQTRADAFVNKTFIFDCTNKLTVVYVQNEQGNRITAGTKVYESSTGTKRWPSENNQGIVTMQSAAHNANPKDLGAIIFSETEYQRGIARYIAVNTQTGVNVSESCVLRGSQGM